MSANKVIAFNEPTRTMTYEEGLAFVERTRRQLDRFEVALPRANEQRIAPGDAANIRRRLDSLEADFKKDLGIA